MIHIHPEDNSKFSKKAMVKFLKGFGTPFSIDMVPSTSHFTGDQWQNKFNQNQLANIIATILLKNEVFIIHYDADITYMNYLQHNLSCKFNAKDTSYNKLKEKVKDNILQRKSDVDIEQIMKRFIRMMTFVDFESWVFVNKRHLKRYLHCSLKDDQTILNLIELDVVELENINMQKFSNTFLCNKKNRGKDIFNCDLMNEYPYGLAVKKLKSINIFYNQNKEVLHFTPHLDKNAFLRFAISFFNKLVPADFSGR